MTIKVALLKSGEDIISDVHEMVLEDKVVGYFFNKPCVVNFRKSSDESFDISIFPWIPITNTTRVPVAPDWIITLVDPIDQLEKMYVNDVLKNETDQTNSLNEQSNSSISD